MKDAMFWDVTLLWYRFTDILQEHAASTCRIQSAAWENHSGVQGEVLRTWLCVWASGRLTPGEGGAKTAKEEAGKNMCWGGKGKETVTSSTLLFHSLLLGYVGSALSWSPTNSPTEACSFHLSVYLTVAYSSTLKMEVARSCRTLVNFYQTTQCHISILENLNTIFFMFSHLSKYSQKFSKRWPYCPKTRERIKLVYFSSHMLYLKVLWILTNK